MISAGNDYHLVSVISRALFKFVLKGFYYISISSQVNSVIFTGTEMQCFCQIYILVLMMIFLFLTFFTFYFLHMEAFKKVDSQVNVGALSQVNQPSIESYYSTSLHVILVFSTVWISVVWFGMMSAVSCAGVDPQIFNTRGMQTFFKKKWRCLGTNAQSGALSLQK